MFIKSALLATGKLFASIFFSLGMFFVLGLLFNTLICLTFKLDNTHSVMPIVNIDGKCIIDDVKIMTPSVICFMFIIGIISLVIFYAAINVIGLICVSLFYFIFWLFARTNSYIV